ncbi:MAG: serine/threonine protein kinase [Verrucomicrobiaceae bacterium]|nr:serine/threonine protein kinase [Verrucomicrobiaceae bacterium]
MNTPHLDDALLQRVLRDDTLHLPEVEAHLEQCAECRARLEHLSGADEFRAEFEASVESEEQTARAILQPTSDPGCIGTLGKYAVRQWIATGGTSTVWLAVAPGSDSIVALKVLQPLLAIQKDHRARFVREAQAAMRLKDPHILPLLEVEANHSPPFLVMPFVDGGTLQDKLQAGPLPAEEVVRIGRAVAQALVAAHGAGIIHRDIKPSNILLSSSGEVLLADFGIARAFDGATLLTQTGSFLGTPQYMSPEQAAGERELGARTDLFSLGAVLYQCCTGTAPFSGMSFQELARSVQESAPVPIKQVQPTTPLWLENLISHLLAKQPADRPASAADVLRAFEQQADLGRLDAGQMLGGAAKWRMMTARWLRRAVVLMTLAMIVLLWTERTGRTSFVNAALCGLSGNAYYITGKWQTFGLLDEAIQAAAPNDVIEVRANDPATGRGGIKLRPGKPLTLRAAAGFRPVLPLQAAGFPALGVLESNFIMEGFVFNHVYRGPRPGRLLHVKGASLKLVNCRFVRQPRNPETLANTLSALIAGTDSPRIELVRCQFYAPGSPVIALISEQPEGRTEVVLKDSHVWGGAVFCDVKPPAHLAVTATGCEFSSSHVLHFKQAFPAKQLTADFQSNLIQSVGAAVVAPWPLEKVRPLMEWKGAGNEWYLPDGFLLTQDTRQPDLTSWSHETVSDRLAMPFDAQAFPTQSLSEEGLPIRRPKK